MTLSEQSVDNYLIRLIETDQFYVQIYHVLQDEILIHEQSFTYFKLALKAFDAWTETIQEGGKPELAAF